MRQAIQLIGYVNLIAFVVLAVVAVFQWRNRRHPAAAWVALTFLSLGLVVILGRVAGQHPHGLFEHSLVRVAIVVLVVFPYLLYRFTTAFRKSGPLLERFVNSMTTLLVVSTLALPYIPETGQKRPWWFLAYVVAFVTHWAVLTIAVAIRLLLAGRGQPTVARRRMQMLSLAATAITIGLILSAFSSHPYSSTALVSQMLTALSALAFLLGLAPPINVRSGWRKPETKLLQDAISDLMGMAKNQEEIAERVLAPTSAIVGARAVAVLNAEGKVIGSFGLDEEQLPALEEELTTDGDEVTRVDFSGGALLVWTSPYAPFFGDEELRILRTLGSMLGLALDRARLFSQEHQARVALEQADELKSNFISLASHELRTPVTTINGFIATLVGRRGTISADKRRLIEDTLFDQGQRMAALVEQLLDLSRLDAAAILINPQPFQVRQRVEEIVVTVAPVHESSIEVDIDPALEAVADGQAFERIVTNLVTNACRYGEPPVVIRATQTDNHFRLVVEDRGQGVPAEFVPQLFERFSRSAESQGQATGTGLGLAIARSYAQAHKGELYYEPRSPRGARFQLVLPRAGARAPAPAAA